MWRVLTGRHIKVTLSFLLVGHTKFAPDWSFGLLKQRFRREAVSSLDNLAAEVEALVKHNKAQLARREDGSEMIPVYDWTTFLKPHCRKIDGTKNYHHFTISANSPGKVFLKLAADSEEKILGIRRGDWNPSPHLLPAVIPLLLSLLLLFTAITFIY